MRQLSDWPRPINDTGSGLHLSPNIHDTRFKNPATLAADMALWRQMGVTWLKVFVNGDSQLEPVKAFCANGFMVIVRLYSDKGPGILDKSWPVDLMRLYRDAGARYCEAFNEPDTEMWLPCLPETITRLAAAYTKFADACAHAGIIPCTPAWEGDRLENWVKPFFHEVIKQGRRDALEGSAVAGHWRPGNHPPDLAAPGFVFRSYELWDDFIRATMGGPLPMLGTEAGYEPDSSEDTTYPKIDLEKHAAYNVKIATMPWRDSLFCQCFWCWCPSWSNSPWVDNPTYGTGGVLPVVPEFCEMPKTVRNGQPEPPPPPPPPVPSVPADMLTKAVNERMWLLPFGIKEAFKRGYVPFGDEVRVLNIDGATWYGQPARRPDGSLCILAFKQGEYTSEGTSEVEYKLP